MTEVNIRGALGTQLIETFTAFADSIKNGFDIDGIAVNIGGDPYHTVTKNYIHHFLDLNGISTYVKNDTKKYGIDGTNIERILCYRHEIFNRFTRFKPVDGFKYVPQIIHVRIGDKQLLSIDRYISISTRYPNHVLMGDDEEALKYIAARAETTYLHQDVIRDWHTMANATSVIAAYSAFPLSGKILNPHLIISFVHHGSYDGPVSIKSMGNYADTYTRFIESTPNVGYAYGL